jgi:UDP-N-acetylmuramate--alanine ligase
VEVGAIIPAWDNNIRIGTGKYFVTEADEFHDNFATYMPHVTILTLLEFDHPEYFKTIPNMLEHYQRLLDKTEILIYNADSPLIEKLRLPKNSTPYHLNEFQPKNFPLGVVGDHNRLNALAVINLAHLLKIPDSVLTKSLSGFHGLHRRMELLGEKNGIFVYDDYANHPTSFTATINAVKETHPTSKIWTVIEPHTFTRLKTFLQELPSSLKNADQVIISQIYGSREKDPGNFSGQDIANAIPNARFIPEFENIANTLKSETKSGDVILVMGSGNSYKLSRQILNSL